MSSRPEPVPRKPRIRLSHLLLAIAVLAFLLAFLVPVVKRAFFPDTWNTWIVKTVTRDDGALVRLRIRRYPDRDAVFTEILERPRPEQPGAGNQQLPDHATVPTDPKRLKK